MEIALRNRCSTDSREFGAQAVFQMRVSARDFSGGLSEQRPEEEGIKTWTNVLSVLSVSE